MCDLTLSGVGRLHMSPVRTSCCFPPLSFRLCRKRNIDYTSGGCGSFSNQYRSFSVLADILSASPASRLRCYQVLNSISKLGRHKNILWWSTLRDIATVQPRGRNKIYGCIVCVCLRAYIYIYTYT